MKKIFLILFLLINILPSGVHAFSSTFDFKTPFRTIKVGEKAVVKAVVNTESSINAVSGIIKIPTSSIKDISIIADTSIVTFWIKKPTLNNDEILFEGIITGGSFSGKNGELFRISYTPTRTTDSLKFSFSESTILVNDGAGTEIDSSMRPISLTVVDILPIPNLPEEDQNLFDISLLPQIETAGAGLVSKVAPGEFFPLSVKLLNFLNRNKVDVTINYKITDLDGTVIYSAEETVAVQTTATFVKTIQIPFETIPGRYIAKSSIIYVGQVASATTEFPFTVERKILGLFQSDFYRYGIIILLLSLFVGIFGFLFMRHRRFTRSTLFDYSAIPHDERVFFELLSDIIMNMRQRVGDRALLIASNVNGLGIDMKTGRVLKLTEKPSKIIAELVSGYEQVFDKKVSFSFRSEKTDSTVSPQVSL